MVDTAVTNVTIGATLSGSFTSTFTRARSEVSRFVSQIRGSTNALQAQTKAFDATTRAANTYATSMRAATRAAEGTERAFRSTASAARESARSTERATRATRDNTLAVDESNRSTSLAVSGQRSLQSALDRTASMAGKARDMIASMSREIQKASDLARRGFNGPDISQMQRRLPPPPGGGGGYGGGSGSPFGGRSFGGNGGGSLMLPPPGGGGGGGGGRWQNNPYRGGGYGGGLIGAYAGAEVAKYMFNRGANYEDEITKMRMAGMSNAQIQSSERRAWETSRNVRGTDVNQNLKAIRELRYALGNTGEAINVLPSVQRSSSMLRMMLPRVNAEDNSFSLVKSLEERGVTNDPARTSRLMEGMTKAMIATGGRVSGTDYLSFTRRAKAAAPNLSDDFMVNTAPFLMQRLGAPQAGNAIAMLERAMIGGHMDKQAVGMLAQMGLYDGTRKSVTQSDLMQSSPDKWIAQVLLPQMEKMGRIHHTADGDLTSDTKAELGRIFTRMYSNSTVASAMTLLATQQNLLAKDRALIQGVASNAYAVSQNSPIEAFHNMTTAFGNLVTAMTHANMPALAKGMNLIADGMNALTKLDHNKLGVVGEVAIALAAMGPAILGARVAFGLFVAPLLSLPRILGGATLGLSGFLGAVGKFSFALGALGYGVQTLVDGIMSGVDGKTKDKMKKATHEDYSYYDKMDNDRNTGFFGHVWAGTNKLLDRAVGAFITHDDTDIEQPYPDNSRWGRRQRVPGHAYGGSFTVKGNTGSDTNLVQFMASAGEQVTVDTKGSKPDGGRADTKAFAREIGKAIADELRVGYLGPNMYGLGGTGTGVGGTGAGVQTASLETGTGSTRVSSSSIGSGGTANPDSGSANPTGGTPDTTTTDSTPAKGRTFFGDSITKGLMDLDPDHQGQATVGFGTGKVLKEIQDYKGDIKGRQIVLSTGAVNDGKVDEGAIGKEIDALKAKGVDPKDITIVGAADNKRFGGMNPQLEALSKKFGTQFTGGFKPGKDGIHPESYQGLTGQIPGGGGGTGGTGGASGFTKASGSRKGLTAAQMANAEESYNFWRGKGATHEQALAWLGNEEVESKFNPRSVGDGGTAHGIAQWHDDRRRNIMRGTGIDIDTATHKQQLEAAYWEMTKGQERAGGRAFLSAKTIEQAQYALVNGYERPKDRVGNVRVRSQIGREYGRIFAANGAVYRQTADGGGVGGPGPAGAQDTGDHGATLAAAQATIGHVARMGVQCVDLVRSATGKAASVATWRPGQRAEEGGLKPGASLATFLDANGREQGIYASAESGYGGQLRGERGHHHHALVFERYGEQGGRKGMFVIEQWKGRAAHRSFKAFGTGTHDINDGSSYREITTADGRTLDGRTGTAVARATVKPKTADASVHPALVKAAQARAAMPTRMAGLGSTVHAPITVNSNNPHEVARIVSAHLEKHEQSQSRVARNASFDWVG